jgi:hypothetical protein
MNIADAKKTLQERRGKHLYDVIIPSLNVKVPFAPMMVGHHKSVAKMAIDDEDNFDKFLCALILDLSNENVNLSDIIEIDKTAILYQIKQHNSTEPLKVSLSCPVSGCDTNFTVQPTDADFIKPEVELQYTNTMNIDGVDYELTIGMPTVMDNIFYYDFCTERAKDLDEEEKTKLGMFIATYEMYLMCIRAISINGDSITDYLDTGIEDRIAFLDELPEGLIIVDDINKFMDDKKKEYSYNVECPKCEHKFADILSTESFFFS